MEKTPLNYDRKTNGQMYRPSDQEIDKPEGKVTKGDKSCFFLEWEAGSLPKESSWVLGLVSKVIKPYFVLHYRWKDDNHWFMRPPAFNSSELIT